VGVETNREEQTHIKASIAGFMTDRARHHKHAKRAVTEQSVAMAICGHGEEVPEPGAHRSVYERAFGSMAGAHSDVHYEHQRIPAPWPMHGDLLDERDHDREEMLYHRQMVMAAQDRARSRPRAPSVYALLNPACVFVRRWFTHLRRASPRGVQQTLDQLAPSSSCVVW